MTAAVNMIPPVTLAIRNRRVMCMALLVAGGSLALGFAAVPLYRIFCQVTGFGGTTQQATSAPGAIAGTRVSVRFDSNVQPGMPWSFRPERETETVMLGEKRMAIFVARNLSDRPVTGTAAFNVTPAQAGAYFAKIQCFCFTEQTLRPGEEMRMPVIYYVDPKMLADKDAADIEEITLSYTFYPVEKSGKRD